MGFRFHVLGLPHTVSSKEFNACAYTQKVVKFCKMMKARGHYIIHYGHEDSKVDCDEQVNVLTNEDWKIAYGSFDWRKNFFKFDMNDHAYQTFFKNAIIEVGLRKQRGDFILPFWGAGTRPVCDAHPDIFTVEPGIGYADGHWANYKVFESYAIYHAYYGLSSVGTCKQNWYDVVIPNYFDLEDFTFKEKKEDYFLFLGRVYAGKGIDVAIQTTAQIGAKLKVAGQSNLQACGYTKIPSHVEFIGYADIEKRKELMANAKGAFIASLYNEPFGGVQVECLLSGTPTITTDWGAFTENNIHGLTGYRCRTFNDFVTAAKNIEKINPLNCRKFGENFSLDNVAPQYERYFRDIHNMIQYPAGIRNDGYHYRGGFYETADHKPLIFDYDLQNKKVYSKTQWVNDPLFFHTRIIPNEPTRCDYESIESEETPQAKNIAKWLKSKNVNKVIDIGCGPGIYTKAILDENIEAKGYDIDSRNDKSYIIKHNIVEQSINDNASCVLCIEVAEHIDEKYADIVVDRIVESSNNMIIFSAAIPGQGGDGHINCQPKEYWLEKFINKNVVRNFELESELINNVKTDIHMGWFVNNVMIFIKKETL